MRNEQTKTFFCLLSGESKKLNNHPLNIQSKKQGVEKKVETSSEETLNFLSYKRQRQKTVCRYPGFSRTNGINGCWLN